MAYACPKYSSMSAAGTDARCTRILLAGGREPQNRDCLVPGDLVLPSASSQGNQPLNIIEQFLVLENHTGLVSLLYPTDGARDPPDAARLFGREATEDWVL